jgi:anti-sigma factor RsiW
MHCGEVQELLDAYVDRELDVVCDTAIETHLQQCQVCGGQYQDLMALRSVLRSKGTYFEPPTSLERRVRPTLRRSTPFLSAPWVSLAAATILLVSLSLSIGAFVFRQSSPANQTERLAQEIVAMHIRSLMVDHLTDIASTDPHVLKPWFSDKLGFAPPAVDLTARQFALVGARMDYVDGHPVAAIIYRRRRHTINLIIAPASSATDDIRVASLRRRGYHLLHWRNADLTYWVISDLNPEELGTFAQLLQSHVS